MASLPLYIALDIRDVLSLTFVPAAFRIACFRGKVDGKRKAFIIARRISALSVRALRFALSARYAVVIAAFALGYSGWGATKLVRFIPKPPMRATVALQCVSILARA